MRFDRLTGLRAGDLPPLDATLNGGLVAIYGPAEAAAEVRRSLVWGAALGDGGVTVRGDRDPAVEPLWGGTSGLAATLDAAARWLAGPSLARVEAARAALTGAPVGAADGVESGTVDAEADGLDPTDPRARLDDALADLRARERELRELRAEWAEVTGDVEQASMDWLRERQDAETQLLAYRDRARELKARLGQIERGGPDAPCPTCGRPLADHLQDVRVQLREEWEAVVQDGRWWKRRREQLEGKPEHLRSLESRGVRVAAGVESGAERVERARMRVRLLESALQPSAPADVDAPEARALGKLAEELRAAAVARVLREAGRIAERITSGRVLWLRPTESGPVAEGVFPGGVPLGRDRAAVELACRLAAALAARDAGAPLEGMVIGESLDLLEPEDRLRAADVLASAAAALGQVIVVTGTDLVDLRPEAFDQALRVSSGRDRAPHALTTVPVGVSPLQLAG